MGHDVVNIGKHSLDVSDAEVLAKDLSKRFKANVEYGYCKVTSTNEIDPEDRDYTFEDIVWGKITYPRATKTFWLHDELYELHQLIDKHGPNWSLDCFKDFSKLELQEASSGVYFELFQNKTQRVNLGDIQKDTFINEKTYFQNRWWCFCRAFTKEDTDGQLLAKVTAYRKKVREMYKIVGGSDVFYFSDQGTHMNFYEFNNDWETIYNTLIIANADTTLNISEFMKHKKLRAEGDYPLAFYDDFADLKEKVVK